MKAIDEQKEECVKAFIASGVDPNEEDEVGDGVECEEEHADGCVGGGGGGGGEVVEIILCWCMRG